MDINILRGLITAVLLLAFIGLMIWIASSKRKDYFDKAAQIPFEEADSQNDQFKSGDKP